LRIIGGEFRSRRLKSVPGLEVRPTPDRLRESLFSILAPMIEGTTFVDAYAGTGSVGLEAASRGAARVVLIEKDPRALAVLRENITSLGLGERAEAVRGKASELVDRYPADILFLDPPYPKENEYALCLEQAAHHTLVIAQHASRFALKDRYGKLERYRTVRQGDNTLSFFRPGGATAPAKLDDQDSGEDSGGA
jgi:16S rRNA (guanine966-N2)-methyltransferase